LQSDRLDFSFTVPEEISAALRLPSFAGKAHLVLDRVPTSSVNVEVQSGAHQGMLTFPAR
jgi:hypothetical protein